MEPGTTLPNLLCEEDNSSLREQKDEGDGFCSVSESDCEYIEIVFQTETSFQPGGDANSVLTETWWFESVRKDIIKWILQKRAEFGYPYSTAYLSMVYFDRFLTRIQISEGELTKLRILSIACLSLAAKMEETETRPLADYTKDEGYKFDKNSITRAECVVLNTLEWRMRCVTPFGFFNYFASKFCEECSDDQQLITRANHLILSIMEEIDVAKHRPSVVAAAAVLTAYDKHLSKEALESKMNAVSSWGAVEKQSTVSCYSLMQEIMELEETPEFVEVETPESVVSHNMAAVDDSTSTSRGTRRRLNFDDHDQDCPPRKTSKE